jgi:cell division protein FtsA
MAKANQNLVTVLDLGSAKTVVLAAEITDAGLRYRGHGIAESRGMRRGTIVDLDKTVKSIQAAVEAAEHSCELPLDSVVVGVSGPHIRAVNSQGGIVLGPRAQEITRDDVRAAVDKARNIVALPEDREVLHLLYSDFILDDQPGIRDPKGMMGRQLEVRLHIVTASQGATQTVVNAINKAAVQVTEKVYEGLACSDAVFTSDEKEHGAALVDIGAGSTNVIVRYAEAAVHTAVLPIGGDHFTNDVATCLPTPIYEAERIKKQFGSAVVFGIPQANEIEVPSIGERPSRMMSQRTLAEILEPRTRELMEMLRDNLRASGLYDYLAQGIVFTGGAAKLNGLLEVAEDVLRKPCRLGVPLGIAKLPAELQEPEFATAIGLIFYAHRARVMRSREEQGFGAKLKALLMRGSGA